MKQVLTSFGANDTICETAEDITTVDKPSREGGQGLPSADFCIMPLIGETKFTIEGTERTAKTICIAYKDRSNKVVFKMVTANSLGRSGKESKEETAKNIPAIEHEITEPIFTVKPSEIINTFKGKVCKKLETKVLFYPEFEDGKPVWENAKPKDTVMREMQDDAKVYGEFRKAFDTFAEEQSLTNVVKLIEKAA